jgi:uncharacterized protein with von Willebrand factor type A (vWA) domain
MCAYRYSQWDGTQDIPSLDADSLLQSISDDLMNLGDLQHALRNLLQRGLRGPEQHVPGLRELLQGLRQRRRRLLDRYDLTSVLEDIRQRLDEILRIERNTLRRRREEAVARLGEGGEQPPADAEGAAP